MSVQHTRAAHNLFAFAKLGVNDGFRTCTFSELCTNTCGTRCSHKLPPPRAGGRVKNFHENERLPSTLPAKMAAEGERDHKFVNKQ